MGWELNGRKRGLRQAPSTVRYWKWEEVDFPSPIFVPSAVMRHGCRVGRALLPNFADE